jgi:GTP-binding protein
VAINKVDDFGAEKGADEFARLGFEKIFPVSAIHGSGITELMEAAMALLPPPPTSDETSTPGDGDAAETSDATDDNITRQAARLTQPLKIAIVGRPNVGKSSIINALTHSHRVIVSPIPGTTRDAIDVPFEVETDGVRQKYILIDTAGMRKTRRVDDSVEFFSVQRSQDSIVRSDITVLVIDAEAGITEQDKKIADVIVESRKACILVINKWDLFAAEVREAREEEIEKRKNKVRTEGQAKELTTLAEFGLGAGKTVFPRLRARHLHLGQIGIPPGPPAGSGALCRGAVAAKNPHLHSEPHPARRRGQSPAHQRPGPPPEILLRHPSPSRAAHLSAVCEP